MKKNDENSMNHLEASFSSSISSSLSADLTDDAISSATSLCLRGGKAQLPVKKGLSKYYDGKSESFRSLSSVKSVEDLAKKRKSCKSYGSNSNRHKFCAKAPIVKKSPKPSSNIMAVRIWL